MLQDIKNLKIVPPEPVVNKLSTKTRIKQLLVKKSEYDGKHKLFEHIQKEKMLLDKTIELQRIYHTTESPEVFEQRFINFSLENQSKQNMHLDKINEVGGRIVIKIA